MGVGCVVKRGERFRAILYLGAEKHLTKQFGSEREAKSWIAKVRNELDTGAFIRPVKITMSELVGRWLSDYAKTNVGPKTGERYEQLLRVHILPALGQTSVNSLMWNSTLSTSP